MQRWKQYNGKQLEKKTSKGCQYHKFDGYKLWCNKIL